MTPHETAKILGLPIIDGAVRFTTWGDADAFRALCPNSWAVPRVDYDPDTAEYCVYLKEV